MSRKIYTKEFKEQAVKLSCVSGKSVAETGSDLGLPVCMLHRWRREAKLTGRVFPGRGIARDEELAELKKRVKQAELERDILKKAVSFYSDSEVTYQFIKSCNGRFPLKGLCVHLGVSWSGYCGWLKRDLIRRGQEDKQLNDVIEAEFNTHRKTYGSRRLRDRLRQRGRRHGRSARR